MVSQGDRNRTRRLAADLADGETDERGTAAQRQAVLQHLNADRISHEVQPLVDRAPEEGL